MRKKQQQKLAKSAQKHKPSPTQPIDYQPLIPNPQKNKNAQFHTPTPSTQTCILFRTFAYFFTTHEEHSQLLYHRPHRSR